MYIVKIHDGPDDILGTEIHTPDNSDKKVTSGVINKEINKIDSFNFSILPNSPAYGQIRPYRTLINVYNTKTNKYDFEGRVYQPSDEMGSDETITYTYIAEGELAYLHDSVQRFLEFRGTPTELFTTILDYHNRHVESYKRFEVGTVAVTDPNDYLYVFLNAEETAWEALNRTLIDKLGGELRIRKEEGVRYLDYVERIGFDSNVSIELEKNLKSMSRDVNPSEIVTRLTPLGERLESEREEDEPQEVSEPRLTIEAVNDGVPYLDRPDLIEVFGIQGSSEAWDDITTPEMLKTRGQQFLNNQKLVLYQYTIEALDLFLIGKDPMGFEIGNSYPLINPVMNIMGERLRIVKQHIDINRPQNSSMTLGDKFKSLLDYQLEQQEAEQRVLTLQKELFLSSRRVTQLGTAYGFISSDIQGIQTTLQNSNVENLPIHLQAIEDQLSAIQRELEQIEPPPSGG